MTAKPPKRVTKAELERAVLAWSRYFDGGVLYDPTHIRNHARLIALASRIRAGKGKK